MLAKGLRHGIADYYLLESEAFMASDRRQRLEDQWQLAALEQISHDVDATAATLNKEKIKEKYFRPLLLCQWWCKSVEHKYNCEGNLAYTRLKTAMQCDSSMRVQVLRFPCSNSRMHLKLEQIPMCLIPSCGSLPRPCGYILFCVSCLLFADRSFPQSTMARRSTRSLKCSFFSRS